jgi:hypothetical protein
MEPAWAAAVETPMRQSSLLLPAAGFIGVFCVTAWWLVREETPGAAVPELRLAETVGPLTNNPVPGNSPEALAAAAAPSPAFAGVPAKSAAKTTDKAQSEQLLAQMRDGLQQEELRRQNPEFRQAQDESRRRDAERTRAEAIRVAGMTDADVDQMFEFAQERLKKVREVIAASYGRPADDVFAEIRRLEDEYQEKLQDVLEPQEYERWQWYGASQSERNEANQFQRDLARNGGEPMQIQHVDRLVEALYTEERRWEAEYQRYVLSTGISDPDKVPPRSLESRLAEAKARNKRIHDAMAGTLTPGQLSRLDEMLAKKLEYLEGAIRYNASLPKPQ